MHHVVSYSASVVNTANIQVNAIPDGIIAITNNNFLLPSDMWLLGAMAYSVTMSRGRLNSAKLRQISPLYVIPPFGAVVPPTDPNWLNLIRNPFRLRGQEELTYEHTHTNAMAEVATCVAMLAPSVEPAPAGDIYPLRWTSTTAAVANVWTLLAVTFELNLPTGRYAVVGGAHQGATGKAFRLTLPNQFWRPGGFSQTALTNRTIWEQYNGGLGNWGSFTTVDTPRIEVLCNAADAAHEGYIQCVKIG